MRLCGLEFPPNMRQLTSLLLTVTLATGASAQAPRDIHLIYMGGDDCPPCVAWRKHELPKLRETRAFQAVRFSIVNKNVKATVPPAWYLPDEVKPYKEQLDIANGRNLGSPQTAIMVNGKVYDYYGGSRSAAEIESMLLAIQEQTPYPFPRCVRRSPKWVCADGG